MPNPSNDRDAALKRMAPKDPRANAKKEPESAPAKPEAAPAKPDPVAGPPPKDSLKLLMPAGEQGVRNPPRLRLATASGGTSAAEDTTRAAGYVADLSARPEPQPGPPVALEPTLVAGPEAVTPPKKDATATATAKTGTKPAPRPAVPPKGEAGQEAEEEEPADAPHREEKAPPPEPDSEPEPDR